MLVITRKRNEELMVGNARIVVLSIEGYRVRLGVEAPPAVRIMRGELIDGSNRQEVGDESPRTVRMLRLVA